MHSLRRPVAVLFLALQSAAAPISASAPLQPPPSSAPVAIRDVTVIAMTGSPPMEHATLILRGDRIASLGPSSEVSIPPGARVVEGAGKYLIPGLIEMHAHLSKARASSLGLFVANGVTTVRDMGGDHDELLGWRREIRAGKRIGPSVLLAGPYLEAASNVERMRKDPPSERVEPFERTRIPVASPADARRIVASLAGRELDFLKIRTVQNHETYVALNEAADRHGLKLVGHVSGISPQAVLDAGQDGIEHWFYPSLPNASKEERLAVWRAFAQKGVSIVPTMVAVVQSMMTTTDRLQAMVNDDEGRIEPRRRYLSKFLVLDWKEQVLEATDQRRAAIGKIWDGVLRDLREMHEAGMDVLVGSDVAVLNVFPGSTLHDEMALFVKDLGMTPADVLDRTTLRSARVLGVSDAIGTIARGKTADLLLLDANPLDDIRHTQRIAAVVLRGVVYDRLAIEKLLAAVNAAPDRRVDEWGRK